MKLTTNRKNLGFTLVEIMIVVAIIGLLAAIAIPNFIRARTQSQKTACINNLRQIDGAIQQWALEKKKSGTDPVTAGDVTEFLGRGAGSFPSCPSAGSSTNANYTLVDVKTAPKCAIAGTGAAGAVAGMEHDLPAN